MPILKIQTNKVIDDRDSFKQKAMRMLSDLLQKSPDYIMIILEEADMLFAGENSPCIYAELKSIGLPEERTAEFSDTLCAFFEDQLTVPKGRIYIEFSDAERHLLGWNGKTFAR